MPDDAPPGVPAVVPGELLEAFLRRIRVSPADIGYPDPSPEGLRRLHAAYVEQVSYENLDIVRAAIGSRSPAVAVPSIDARESLRRIVSGRGGYCYHLNGALALVLATLGYDVRRHVGAVWVSRADNADDTDADDAGNESVATALGNHLALSVELDDVTWFVDAGLGDALHEPIAVPGHGSVEVSQGPFSYRLKPSSALPGGLRFVHDPAQKSFTAMDFGFAPVSMDRFAARHHELSTSPQSGFVTVLTLQRRDALGVDSLKGCMLTRHDSAGRAERELTTSADWFAAARDVFALALDEVGPGERGVLWAWLRGAHEAWTARP